jgi:hypothetical protein
VKVLCYVETMSRIFFLQCETGYIIYRMLRPSISIIKRYNGNDPQKNRVLPLLEGNHVAKFVKDPIYRNKVIVRKRETILLSNILFIVTVNLTFDLMTPK